jgi:hypothetical protein
VQIPDSFTLTHREPIVRVIAHHRLPAVYSNNSHQVRSGHQPQGALGLAVPSPSPQKDLWIAAGALVANRQKFHFHACKVDFGRPSTTVSPSSRSPLSLMMSR